MSRNKFLLFSILTIFLAVGSQSTFAQYFKTHHVRKVVRNGKAAPVGLMSPNKMLTLNVVLPLTNEEGLHEFLNELYDPNSPEFHQFLTPTQFTALYGPSVAHYDATVAYLKANGFTVIGGSRKASDVTVRGPVSAVNAAFHVTMRVYHDPVQNRNFYSPDRTPTTGLNFDLWHVSGLNNYSIPHPMVVSKKAYAQAHGLNPRNVSPQATTGSGPSASFLGSDMRGAYYGTGSLTGAGQNLGLLEYYGTDLADLNTYYSNIGQTNNVPITLYSPDGTSTSCTAPKCDDTEQTLDMTQALGMAPGLNNLTMYIGNSDTAIIGAMVSHNPLPTTIGCSWAWTPVDPSTLDPYFQQMAAQGQNFFAASGDHSTWGNTQQTEAWPADSDYVVGVGGTDLTTSSAGGPWQSETAWVDSGGGTSVNGIAIPSWQQLPGVINTSNGGSTSVRNGPDVSANANFTFYVCADQSGCTANQYGGTSFAAPMWAGYIALVNQQLVANGDSTIGFLNPIIYNQNATSSSTYAADFHDITSGTSGSFSAVTGYDLVTGWGSPNAGLLAALVNSVTPTPDFTISASPTSLSVTQGNSGTSTIATSVTGSFNNAISLSASGAPSGVNVSFSPTSIAAPGSGTSTATFQVGTSAAAGTYNITITGSGGGITHTTTVSLTVKSASDFSISASPTSLSVTAGNSGSSTISSSVTGGFSNSISLSSSGAPTGVTVTFGTNPIAAGGSSSVTFQVASTATAGTYPITITGTSGSLTHSTSISLTVKAASTGDFTITPASTSLSVAPGSSVTDAITIAANSTFNSSVSLTTSVTGKGVHVSLSTSTIAAPGSGTSTLTFTANKHAATGTDIVTITATGGGITHTSTISVTVGATASPDFTITPSASSVSATPGSSTSDSVTTTATNGFDNSIALSASGAPSGVTVSLSPTSIAAPGSGSSTVTFQVASGTTAGTYPITITGTGGGVTHSTSISLTVSSTSSGDFSITASPTSLTVPQGTSASDTITITGNSNFTSSVSLSTSVNGKGVHVSLSPSTISGGSGTATLTFTANSHAKTGSDSVTITATGGGVTHTITIPVTVTP